MEDKGLQANEDIIKKVTEEMPDDDLVLDLAELYKVFGDSTRLKILVALKYEELGVSDISKIVNMSISAVSHQLRVLRQMNLVRFQRKGKEIYYSLADEHVEKIISIGMDHIEEERWKKYLD